MLVLSALWGASYLFIKIALDDLSPAGIVFTRTALAALSILPFAIRAGGLGEVLRRWWLVLALAAIQVAGPFLLISEGERHIASSLTGILVASAPVFTAILAVFMDHTERLDGKGAVGVAIAIAGIVLLFGVDIQGSGVLGGLAVVLASVGYALGGHLLKRWFTGLRPIALVTGTMAASALLMLPLFLTSLPDHVGADTAAAMSALGVGGTGIAFVIYYVLNAEIGPTRTAIVAYVAPVFAVVYGVTLLDESFTAGTAAGIVLILGGSWLAANSGRTAEPVRQAVAEPVA
jgi:drug/metabolite transporter (DMT)-like permease